jgi:hypothetical protein
MPSSDPLPPKTIPQLWSLIDRRLLTLELQGSSHAEKHACIDEILKDHESRIRSGLTFYAVLTGTGGILSLIALVKSFLQ